MRTLGPLGMKVFNALLRRWRSEGRNISWPELNHAFQLARDAEQAERDMRGREK